MCAMSMNAQVVKLYKNGQLKYTYSISEVDEVKFEEQLDPTPQTYNFYLVDPCDFTGFTTNTLTASNEDVSVMLTLSGGEAWWNHDGQISLGSLGGYRTLTVTVTPVSGVTVTGITLSYNDASISRIGEGPSWNFSVDSTGAISGNDGEVELYGVQQVRVDCLK